MTPSRLYTLRELSETTGKPEPFLRELIRRGLLACHQNCSRGRIHVTIEQWQAYLDETETSQAVKASSRRRKSRGKGSAGRGQGSKSRRDPASYAELTF